MALNLADIPGPHLLPIASAIPGACGVVFVWERVGSVYQVSWNLLLPYRFARHASPPTTAIYTRHFADGAPAEVRSLPC